MIFWDTSGLVPLIVDEPLSARARRLAHSGGAMVVWWGTATECLSALARREREAVLSPAAADQARALLMVLQRAWHEILATETVRAHAARLLRRHPLRAADALQLAAALTWAAGRPTASRLATFDQRLAEAARGEGFELVF